MLTLMMKKTLIMSWKAGIYIIELIFIFIPIVDFKQDWKNNLPEFGISFVRLLSKDLMSHWKRLYLMVWLFN